MRDLGEEHTHLMVTVEKSKGLGGGTFILGYHRNGREETIE